MGHVTLVTIAGTTILVPYHLYKSCHTFEQWEPENEIHQSPHLSMLSQVTAAHLKIRALDKINDTKSSLSYLILFYAWSSNELPWLHLLIDREGTRIVVPVMATSVTCPILQFLPRIKYIVCGLVYFVVVRYRLILSISFKVSSLALGQSNDCPSASEVTLKDKVFFGVDHMNLQWIDK